MKILQPNTTQMTASEPANEEVRYCATIGFFDGVHRGHQFLLCQLKNEARRRGMQSLVVTFATHPRKTLLTDYRPKLLTPTDEKILQLSACGVDACAVLDFTPELAALSAAEFMEKYLLRQFSVACLIVGYDHRFGTGRAEGFPDYVRHGKNLGIEVLQAEAFVETEQTVSSSVVRRQLEAGNVREAAQNLGRPYALYGTVVEGRRVGRQLGFPTANLRPSHPDLLIPACGVYAVRAEVEGNSYGAMLNIGRRPTLDNGNDCSIEAHLFDFSGILYGKQLRLHFVDRLRDEMKFESLEALKQQLKADAQESLQRLRENAEKQN